MCLQKNKKTIAILLLVLLPLLWALVSPAICSAEPVYQITEAELVALEQNSNRQLAISKQLTTELETARQQLKISEQASSEAKLQTEQLQKQLTELEAWSKKQEALQKEILKSLPPSAPVVLREVGVKIDIDKYARGASYGVSRRVGSKYIGIRAEYDWQDSSGGIWLTYAY